MIAGSVRRFIYGLIWIYLVPCSSSHIHLSYLNRSQINVANNFDLNRLRESITHRDLCRDKVEVGDLERLYVIFSY